MNKRELQIGDWVNFNGVNPRYSIVTALGNDGVNVCNYWMEEDCIGPIPLSPEILEKNGWKEAQFWHEYQDGKNNIQSCLPDMRGIINGVEIQHFKCEYVHQYQHLLRLCGLDELADKFVV